MNLLLTNDDGIDGIGLRVLAERLAQDNTVWIVAPSRNRSAVSHGITMNTPLQIKKTGENAYSCSGMPVDCVVTALRSNLLPNSPDMVISGINKGANIGTDLLYSGTAAAARQAVLYGVPGVAFSIESFDDTWQYEAMADFAAKNLVLLGNMCETIPSERNPSGTNDGGVFVNVNALSLPAYKGVKFTSLSTRVYNDTVLLYTAPNGSVYSFFSGGEIVTKGSDSCDYEVVRLQPAV